MKIYKMKFLKASNEDEPFEEMFNLQEILEMIVESQSIKTATDDIDAVVDGCYTIYFAMNDEYHSRILEMFNRVEFFTEDVLIQEVDLRKEINMEIINLCNAHPSVEFPSVDSILDKISDSGVESLTEAEKMILSSTLFNE